MKEHKKVAAPVLYRDGRTSDGRYAIDVTEYAAVVDIGAATAWRRVRSGAIASIQPTGKHGRVKVPVHAVLAELGIAASSEEVL